jgi:hypothetical protein
LAAETRVLCKIDLSHASRAQLAHKLIWADTIDGRSGFIYRSERIVVRK